MMKKVMVSSDRSEIGFVRGVLEAEGIRCSIKNEFLSGASGELPINETWPELWVAGEDWAKAMALVGDLEAASDKEPWQCPECGEQIEGQFSECWLCSDAVKD